MERLLEKSLDDQFAMERERKAEEDDPNRRLLWAALPVGVALAIAAMCTSTYRLESQYQFLSSFKIRLHSQDDVQITMFSSWT